MSLALREKMSPVSVRYTRSFSLLLPMGYFPFVAVTVKCNQHSSMPCGTQSHAHLIQGKISENAVSLNCSGIPKSLHLLSTGLCLNLIKLLSNCPNLKNFELKLIIVSVEYHPVISDFLNYCHHSVDILALFNVFRTLIRIAKNNF